MNFYGRTKQLDQLKNEMSSDEVKFRKKRISREVIDTEIQQVKSTGLNCYKYVFFSRAGFMAEETDEIKHIDLAHLYR